MYGMDEATKGRKMSWPKLNLGPRELFKCLHGRLHWPVVVIVAVDQKSMGLLESRADELLAIGQCASVASDKETGCALAYCRLAYRCPP